MKWNSGAMDAYGLPMQDGDEIEVLLRALLLCAHLLLLPCCVLVSVCRLLRPLNMILSHDTVCFSGCLAVTPGAGDLSNPVPTFPFGTTDWLSTHKHDYAMGAGHS